MVTSSLELYAPQYPSRQDRRAMQTLNRRTAVARAADIRRADLAANRISLVTKLTAHGLAGASLIAYEAEAAAQRSPWAAEQIAGVATAGIAGIRSVITDVAMGL